MADKKIEVAHVIAAENSRLLQQELRSLGVTKNEIVSVDYGNNLWIAVYYR